MPSASLLIGSNFTFTRECGTKSSLIEPTESEVGYPPPSGANRIRDNAPSKIVPPIELLLAQANALPQLQCARGESNTHTLCRSSIFYQIFPAVRQDSARPRLSPLDSSDGEVLPFV